MRRIDLNADLGEGCGDDDAILGCISSANIACGGHAGDAHSMRLAVESAQARGVRVGAHPSYPDRANFGRQELQMDKSALLQALVDQIQCLYSITQACGVRMWHVKPHGALYNQAARDPELAHSICDAVAKIDSSLVIVGLANSEMTRIAEARGFQVLHEAFVDRRYQSNGQLVARSEVGATIDEIDLAIEQAMTLLEQKNVKSIEGDLVFLQADTLCLHGDGLHALQLARSLNTRLAQTGWQLVKSN